ncbi:MAG: XTP/dITP diphosphatase [Candidatus Lokiarchaeota archaeon]|nr:XTP/dITP diphosphatase [Candidatus Lokiarchaeota archaeon]
MSKDNTPLILVTQNKHKLKELTPLFERYDVNFETSPIEKTEVRSQSVEIIAKKAAQIAYDSLNRPVVLDDTGFYIEHLDGFPGAYAAYVLDTIGTAGILKLMEDATDRTARFITGVGYCDSHQCRTFEGVMEGQIGYEEAGGGGFGYDPIFKPEGFEKTYAELAFSEKVEISHRTRAFKKFLKWYTT